MLSKKYLSKKIEIPRLVIYPSKNGPLILTLEYKIKALLG